MGRLKKHLNEVVLPLWNAAEKCETEKDHYMNAVLGLVGEAGEVADHFKKHYFHKKQPPSKELLLEMGDVMFYWLKLANLLGFSLEEILDANRAKLFERYADRVK